MKRVPKKKSHSKPSSKSSGQIRIIAGTHRGRKLPVLDLEGLRPTTDRQKETLFNWLMGALQSAVCLDVFAGSGSLGIESLSRGAEKVIFIEKDKHAANQIEDNLRLLNIPQDKSQVCRGDALQTIAQQKTLGSLRFDVVFIDPPFNKNLVQATIEHISTHLTLEHGAYIYIEAERQHPVFELPENWKRVKEASSKQATAYLYQIQ